MRDRLGWAGIVAAFGAMTAAWWQDGRPLTATCCALACIAIIVWAKEDTE